MLYFSKKRVVVNETFYWDGLIKPNLQHVHYTIVCPGYLTMFGSQVVGNLIKVTAQRVGDLN